MFSKIKKYIKDSVNELKKVNWLTKKETLNLTLEVILFSLVLALIYGLFDGLFLRILFSLK